MVEPSKPTVYRPAYKAEFNMGQLDYNRFDEYLRGIDYWMVEIRMGDFTNVHKFYSWLRQIYAYLKSVSYETRKAELDKKFDSIENQIWAMKNQKKKFTNKEFLKSCEELCDEVYNLRQLVGMGIAVSKNFTDRERLSKALEN